MYFALLAVQPGLDEVKATKFEPDNKGNASLTDGSVLATHTLQLKRAELPRNRKS